MFPVKKTKQNFAQLENSQTLSSTVLNYLNIFELLFLKNIIELGNGRRIRRQEKQEEIIQRWKREYIMDRKGE